MQGNKNNVASKTVEIAINRKHDSSWSLDITLKIASDLKEKWVKSLYSGLEVDMRQNNPGGCNIWAWNIMYSYWQMTDKTARTDR